MNKTDEILAKEVFSKEDIVYLLNTNLKNSYEVHCPGNVENC